MAFGPADFDHSPCADHPGWQNWNLTDETLFNGSVMGRLIARREREMCRLRMFPERRHLNLQGIIHGAVTQSLIDIGLFATMYILGIGKAGPSVTLEVSTQFIGAGKADTPLDAVTEIMRETGRLVFVRGTVEQGEHRVAAFSGIIRKLASQ